MAAKRILVAGGAGFIGSHLCDILVEDGNEVLIVDNLVTGNKNNIEHLLKDPKVHLLEHDIRRPMPQTDAIDQIYNLASPASPKDFKTIGKFILETGAIGHRNLLDLAIEKKARILFASTSEVYGDPEVHPQTENYYGNVNCIGERACYDEAKRFGEALTVNYERTDGIETRIARIFNTYGPRMNPQDGRIIPNFFTQAIAGKPLTIYGDGSQTRSFCYVSDLAQGLISLMNCPDSSPVNLGNRTERSAAEMADIINKLTGNQAGTENLPLPGDDPKLRRPDTSRAEKLFGWAPKVELEDGLKKTYDFFKSL